MILKTSWGQGGPPLDLLVTPQVLTSDLFPENENFRVKNDNFWDQLRPWRLQESWSNCFVFSSGFQLDPLLYFICHIFVSKIQK